VNHQGRGPSSSISPAYRTVEGQYPAFAICEHGRDDVGVRLTAVEAKATTQQKAVHPQQHV
jgi:hypothetical protein